MTDTDGPVYGREGAATPPPTPPPRLVVGGHGGTHEQGYQHAPHLSIPGAYPVPIAEVVPTPPKPSPTYPPPLANGRVNAVGG